jgi:hypothetical protein
MPELYSLHRLSLAAPGEPLFAALSAALPGLSRHLARQAVTAGLVKVDGAAVLQPKHLLGAGTTSIECDLRHGIKAPLRARIHDATPPAEKPFTIVYEDHSLVVVNKAVGILSAPQHQAGSMDPPERGHVPELLRRAFRKQGKDRASSASSTASTRRPAAACASPSDREAQRLLAVQFATHAGGAHLPLPGHARSAQGRGHHRRESSAATRTDGAHWSMRTSRARRPSPISAYCTASASAPSSRCGSRPAARTRSASAWRRSAARCSATASTACASGRRARLPPPPKAPRLMLHAHVLALDHPLTGRASRRSRPFRRPSRTSPSCCDECAAKQPRSSAA